MGQTLRNSRYICTLCPLPRSYDAILGVVSHDWVHQLGEEAVQAGINPTTKEEVLRYTRILEIIL
jgi:hypothetical protein